MPTYLTADALVALIYSFPAEIQKEIHESILEKVLEISRRGEPKVRLIVTASTPGERVETIKSIRSSTGWTLKETKDFCDEISSTDTTTGHMTAQMGKQLSEALRRHGFKVVVENYHG